jgi:hypothetical protein
VLVFAAMVAGTREPLLSELSLSLFALALLLPR